MRTADRVTAPIRRLLGRAQPNTWSFRFGMIALGCLTVLVITGLLLLLWYEPSGDTVRYGGSYRPLRGLEVSRAYASVLHLSFEVTGGLLLRQAHHWAALVLPAALLLQLLSTFFSGAFRRPRHWLWALLVGMFLLVLVSGWSGYGLPDDTLSATGLRIVQGVTLGIPLVGTWLTGLLFGGEFPGRILEHLYVVHLAAPIGVITLLALRIGLDLRHRPGPRPGRTSGETTAAARSTGLFVLTAAVLFLMAATLTVSPVWLYGPASSSNAYAGSQPDWYTAFLDGALRLVPSGWEVSGWGRTWSLAILVPLLVVSLFFLLVALYPILEEQVTGDRGTHAGLDRARNTPHRTAVGVAGMVFFGTLWLAGGADVIALQLRLSFEGVIRALRLVLLVGPPLGYLLARSACRALQAADRERRHEGAESGRIVRRPDGGYVEDRTPLSARQRQVVDPADRAPQPSPIAHSLGKDAA